MSDREAWLTISIIIISLLFLILNELKNINVTQLAHQEEVVIINIIKRIVLKMPSLMW